MTPFQTVVTANGEPPVSKSMTELNCTALPVPYSSALYPPCGSTGGGGGGGGGNQAEDIAVPRYPREGCLLLMPFRDGCQLLTYCGGWGYIWEGRQH